MPGETRGILVTSSGVVGRVQRSMSEMFRERMKDVLGVLKLCCDGRLRDFAHGVTRQGFEHQQS
jgi:hypothetical protein